MLQKRRPPSKKLPPLRLRRPAQRAPSGADWLARSRNRDDTPERGGLDLGPRAIAPVGDHAIVELFDSPAHCTRYEMRAGRYHAPLRQALRAVLDHNGVRWTLIGVFRLGRAYEDPADMPVTLVICVEPFSTSDALAFVMCNGCSELLNCV